MQHQLPFENYFLLFVASDFLCLRISVFEVSERNILDIVNEILVAGMNVQLLQHFDQYEAEDELNRQVAFLR